MNHRCAGEWVTIALVKRAVRLLTTRMLHVVPAQDLRVDKRRMPTVLGSRVVMMNVKRVP